MIVIGGVIGAGIFRTPATVAQLTSSGGEVILFWTLGGLLTLAGVLCYAELGARRPQAGGVYIYLREAFGQLPAFLFGWTMALINYPGSVAAVATTFADYFCAAIGLPLIYVKPVAVGAIAFIVSVNLFGIRAGAWMQNIFTVLKLAAIAAALAGIKRLPFDPLPRSLLPLWRQDIQLDHHKADAELGFARTAPDEAIARAATWFKAWSSQSA